MSGSRVEDVARADKRAFAPVADPDARISPDANGSAELRRWPSLEADIELLGGASRASGPARVAIASYEFNGIVRNGGIGTACTSLVKALAAEGHEVDLFFTGWADDPSEEAFERWRAEYARYGARLHWFDFGQLAFDYDAPVYSAAHSLALYEQLRSRDAERPYDAIHFVESVGHGFYSLMAKRQGLAFERATTVVGVHSPRRWMAEAHGELFDSPEYLADEFLERRSIELADVVVSPSSHMLDWLTAHGVRLPERSYVQQYVTDFDRRSNGRSSSTREAVEELVFFGRLESRKGLPAFCEALELLAERPHGDLRRVTFLGRHSPVEGVASDEYIAARARDWPWEHEVLADLDREEALEYLGKPGRLAVMASPIDNSPNTVYEAIGLDIPFVASNGGGIGELVHPDDRGDMTFDPRDDRHEEIDPADPRTTRSRHTGQPLVARLEDALHRPVRTARFAMDPAANREVHMAWHRAVAAASPSVAAPASPNGGPPLTVVHLSEAERLSPGPDEEFLLLVDPDVERDPRLASALLSAARAAPDAALVTSLGTCELEAHDGSVHERCYLPTGGPTAFGVVANCFGRGAVLARRATFERLGILDREASLGIGVAGILARAAVAGDRIDVVPEALYSLSGVAPEQTPPSRWDDQVAVMRPLHEWLGSEQAAFADMAWRLARQREELNARAVLAEHQLVAANERLGVITSSRSWRLTGMLRRLAGRLRRRPR
jgi:glycosyltransferase involved in cell wall biosynthesis